MSAAWQLLASDLEGKLAVVQAPTLLVWGERDALVPPSVAERLRVALPDSRLALMRGVGHTPMWERPGEFNQLVLDFLSGGAAPAT